MHSSKSKQEQIKQSFCSTFNSTVTIKTEQCSGGGNRLPELDHGRSKIPQDTVSLKALLHKQRNLNLLKLIGWDSSHGPLPRPNMSTPHPAQEGLLSWGRGLISPCHSHFSFLAYFYKCFSAWTIKEEWEIHKSKKSIQNKGEKLWLSGQNGYCIKEKSTT